MKEKKEKKFGKRHVINILITLVIAFLVFYIFLPPLNIRTMEFWMYLIFIYIIYLLLSISSFFGYAAIKGDIKSIKLSKTYKIMIGVVPGLLLLILIVNIILSPMFCSGSYASRIEIVEGKTLSNIAFLCFSHHLFVYYLFPPPIHMLIWCQSCSSRWQMPERQTEGSDNP